MKDLDRFIKAHEKYYEIALKEIENGHKESHWIWFIFPNLKVFSGSEISYHYGLDDLEEAKEYLNNPLLKSHLLEISMALLNINKENIMDIVEFPDNLKICSSMTMFSVIEPDNEIFKNVIKKYFQNKEDEKTLMFIKTISKK